MSVISSILSVRWNCVSVMPTALRSSAAALFSACSAAGVWLRRPVCREARSKSAVLRLESDGSRRSVCSATPARVSETRLAVWPARDGAGAMRARTVHQGGEVDGRAAVGGAVGVGVAHRVRLELGLVEGYHCAGEGEAAVMNKATAEICLLRGGNGAARTLEACVAPLGRHILDH